MSGSPNSLADPKPSFFERFHSPEAQDLIERHFRERLSVGIFTVYNAAISEAMAATYSGMDEIDDDTVQSWSDQIVVAEFPLLVTADRDSETQAMTDIHLQKIDILTGKSMRGGDSFISVADIGLDGEVSRTWNGFTKTHADLILRQAIEQIEVGLDPRYLYSDVWEGWGDIAPPESN